MSTWLLRSGLASLILAAWLSALPSASAQSPYGGIGGGLGGVYPGGAVSPYVAMGGGGVSGYTPYGGGSGGGGYGSGSQNPYIYYTGQGNGGIYGEAGGALYGAAQVINAYGNALNAQEQTRIMRQQYYQMQIETARRKFDLEQYIAAKTPTFTEIQEKVAKMTLRRVQYQAGAAEIASGKALNILLDDAARFPPKRPNAAAQDLVLPADVLAHLNISSGKVGNSLGLLRNYSKITWPVALREVMTPEQQKDISVRAEALVRDAGRGKPDANVYKDLRNSISATRDRLLRKANDIPGDEYMQAKRFLTDMESALRAALDDETVKAQGRFDSFVDGKPKNIQEVVEYMANNGLRFAPSTQGDEAAYRALHNALVNYDVALNALYGTDKENKGE